MRLLDRILGLLLFVIVLAAVPITALVIDTHVEAPAVETKSVLLIVLAGSMLTFGSVRLVLFGWRERFHPGLLAMLIWLFYSVLLIVTHENRTWAMMMGAPGLAAVVFGVFVATGQWNLRRIYTLAAVGALTALVMALYGLLQVLGIDFLPWMDPETGRPISSSASTLGNKNYVGAYLAAWVVFGLPFLVLPVGRVIAQVHLSGSPLPFGRLVLLVIAALLLGGVALALRLLLGFPVVLLAALVLLGLVPVIVWLYWLVRSDAELALPAIRLRVTQLHVACAVILAVLGLTVLVSLSRGAFLGMMIGLAALFFLAMAWLRSWFVRGLVVAALLALLTTGICGAIYTAQLDRFGGFRRTWVTGLLVQSTSFAARIVLWQVALDMWRERVWTGLGMGQFPMQFLGYFERLLLDPENAEFRELAKRLTTIVALQAHNEYLQLLAEQGILGLLLLLFVCFGALLPLGSALLERARRGVYGWEDAIRAGVFGSLLCYAGDALWAFPLRLPANALNFFLFLGLAIALTKLPQRRRGTRFGRLGGVVLGALAIVGGTILWLHGLEQHIANRYYQEGYLELRAAVLAKRDDVARRAERKLRRCLELAPSQGRALFQLGNVAALVERDKRKAIQLYQEASRSYVNPVMWENTAECYFDLGLYDKAEEIWRVTHVLRPEERGTLFKLGQLAYRQNDFVRAIAYFQEEIDKFTGPQRVLQASLLADCYLYLGFSYEYHKQYVRAITALSKSLALRPKHVQANYHLGRIYAMPDQPWSNIHSALYFLTEALRGAQELRQTKLEYEIKLLLGELHARVRDAIRRQEAGLE